MSFCLTEFSSWPFSLVKSGCVRSPDHSFIPQSGADYRLDSLTDLPCFLPKNPIFRPLLPHT